MDGEPNCKKQLSTLLFQSGSLSGNTLLGQTILHAFLGKFIDSYCQILHAMDRITKWL